MSKDKAKKAILDEGSLFFSKPTKTEKEYVKRINYLTNQHLLNEKGEIKNSSTHSQSVNSLMNRPVRPSQNAENINFYHESKDKILSTFMEMLKDSGVKIVSGGCHSLSSVLYILLKEQGIESDLCIGEIDYPGIGCSDHSWIEINQIPFDIAIQLTSYGHRNSPVYAGYDLDYMVPTKCNYRHFRSGLSEDAKGVCEKPFIEYMDEAEGFIKTWTIVERVGKAIGLKLERESLRTLYKGTQRKLIVKGNK